MILPALIQSTCCSWVVLLHTQSVLLNCVWLLYSFLEVDAIWVFCVKVNSWHPFPPPPLFAGEVEDELLHTYTKVYTFDTLLLMVRLAVLVAVTLTVPIVLFPVSPKTIMAPIWAAQPWELCWDVAFSRHSIWHLFTEQCSEVLHLSKSSSSCWFVFVLNLNLDWTDKKITMNNLKC